jgi:hypothetical protein
MKYSTNVDHYVCHGKHTNTDIFWFDLIEGKLVPWEEGRILKQIIALNCRECSNFNKNESKCAKFGEYQGRKRGFDVWDGGYDDWTFESSHTIEYGKKCPEFIRNPLLDPEFFIVI